MHVLGLFLSLLRVPSDLNLLLFQFIFTVFFAFGFLFLIKNIASNYFVLDTNFDSSSSISSFGGSKFNDDSRSSESEMAAPGGIPCVVCGKDASSHCSGCKVVRYCSQGCQSSHWKSEHKNTCKSIQVSGKAKPVRSGSVLPVKRPSSGVPLILASRSSKNLNKSKEVLFPYDEFVQLFNWGKPGNPPCGLLNCGNSCFANVVLQCLACTRPLVAYLLEKGHQRECRRNDWCFMCELQSHVARATRTLQPFSPINILSRLPNIGGNLGYGKQEDAHEFMRFAIDTMQSVCLDEFGGEKAVHPRAQETTLIQHIFGGHLQSQVVCTKCGNVSNQFENMMDLTVEIQGDAASLEECLDQFTITEHLHGDNMYKCDGCNDYVLAWKRLTILRAPNILTIALKRFQSGRFGKLNKRVSFPETLDLSPYISEAGKDGDVYKLYAVVVHVDMLNASYFGHYICYTKDFSGNWYRIDDCKVHRVELEEVLSQGAYMLLYSRVCVRTSCLNPMKPERKHEEEMLKVAQEVVPGEMTQVVVPSEKQAANFSAVSSTDIPLVSAPLLSDTSSQAMNFGNENAKEDTEMVDSEVNLSSSMDVDAKESGCYDEVEESVSALEISQKPISEVNNTSTVREYNLEEQELPFQDPCVEKKEEADESSADVPVIMDSLDNKTEPYLNGVCENGVAVHNDALARVSTNVVLNESEPYNSSGNAEKESGEPLPPSHISDVGAGTCNGRRSLGSKPKPLFSPGFLQVRPPRKYPKKQPESPAKICNLNGENSICQDPDDIRDGGSHIPPDLSTKLTINSEDGVQMVTGVLSDSFTPEIRSSGSLHVSCDNVDIGDKTSSVKDTIPVNGGHGFGKDEAHSLNSEVKPEKLDIGKGSSSSFRSVEDVSVEDVSTAGVKDGRNFSGSKQKPLFRPGFLGKHPREKYSKQEPKAPTEIGHVLASACNLNDKINGHAKPDHFYRSTGDSEDGESQFGEQ